MSSNEIRKKRVVVVGGGVGGLSVAHELAERGFEVHLYERKSVFGGKARSIAFSPKAGVSLPAEHGFRFFPGFYKHVIDTMTRIPFDGGSTQQSVADNLVNVAELVALGDVAENPVVGVLPLQTVWASFVKWAAFLPSFLDVAPGPDGKRLTGADLSFFAGRIWSFLAMCEERREAELEGMPWSEFIGSGRSFVYQKYLSVGLTRNLVACKADKASAFTVGTIGFQLLMDVISGLFKPSRFDRVLNGPTSAVWIDPWVAHLRAQGVAFHADRELCGIDLAADVGGPRISRLRFAPVVTPSEKQSRRSMAKEVDADARELASMSPERAHENLAARPPVDAEDVVADYYVFAVPVEQMATFITPSIGKAVPQWSGLPDLAKSLQWMNGVLFYMTKKSDLPTAHTDYLDSDWALTSIDQGENLWPDWLRMRGTDPDIAQIVSVDVSDWTAPRTSGNHVGHSASTLTREDVIEETWQQVKQALVGRVGYAIDDEARRYSFVDDDIQQRLSVRKLLTYHRWRRARGCNEQPMLTNAEPLLVNQVGTRTLRPEAAGATQNAFLASDYVKTVTDLATMEGANEAARRAVNGLLAKEGRSDFCTLFPMTEPLGGLRDWDRTRFVRGLPPAPVVAVGGALLGWGVRAILWVSQCTDATIRLVQRVEGLPARPREVGENFTAGARPA